MRTAERETASDRQRLLGELYETHALQAFRFAYVLTGDREIAEDLVQEAFLRSSHRLPALREMGAFHGYLRTTILNLTRAMFRRQRIERLSLRRHALLTGIEHGVEVDLAERERLWRVLHRLPYRQRAALVLRYYEDLSERDAAQALGVSVSAIKALVSRGSKTLRVEIEGQREGRAHE